MQPRVGRGPTYYSGLTADLVSTAIIVYGILFGSMVAQLDATATTTTGTTETGRRSAAGPHAWTVRPWTAFKDTSAPNNLMMHPEHASIIKDFYGNQNMDTNNHLAFHPGNFISTTTLPTPHAAFKWTVVSGGGGAQHSAVATTTAMPAPAAGAAPAAYDTLNLGRPTAETRSVVASDSFVDTDRSAVSVSPATDSTLLAARSNIHQQHDGGHSHAQTNGASREVIKSSSPSSSSSGTRILTAATATNSSAATSLKSHKTDAPMLNYIFDSHLATNKHHHHDRYGPHFDDARLGLGQMNVTVQIGTAAYLNCRISLLQDKTVSWVKREHENDRLDLLTVGTQTYTGDSRFSVEFQYPNNWRLRIADANKSDEGLYECQISTYPPRVIKTYFRVRSPEVVIADEHGALLVDKFYEVDSTIQLVCIVRHIAMATSAVYWTHGDRALNFDMTRGGISVRTDLMDNGANSTLSIAKIRKQDSGNYTCSIGPNDFYTMTLHVLNGNGSDMLKRESLAELYHGQATTATRLSQMQIIGILLLVTVLRQMQSWLC